MRNFDPIRELADQRGDEWRFGAVDTDLALIPLTERLTYAPDGVLQFNNVFDTNGCASRAVLNILEAKLNYFYDHGMHPSIKQWCDDHGYRVNGKFVLCDAFIEILSGTTRQGNSLKAPVDTVYRYGVIPAHLIPLQDGMTWEEYMAPSRVTEEHKALGKEFLKRIGINYEQVPLSRFMEALEEDLLDVAGHAWPNPQNGVYLRSNGDFNHAFACVTGEIDALDNYVPFTKKLAKDYRFWDWGYSLSITRQNPFPDETLTVFETLRTHGLLSFFARFLELFNRSEPKATVLPTVPPSPPVEEKKDPLAPLIAALIQVESEGNDFAIGDKHLTHKAYGCLQIRQPVCDDVNKKHGLQLKAQHMIGNRPLSIEVFKKYMDIWCTEERLGRAPRFEDMARIHNGGPSGHKKASTAKYWQKVQKELARNGSSSPSQT